MTHRRKFIKQVAAAGIAGTVSPFAVFQKQQSPAVPGQGFNEEENSLYVGWAVADITPERPVALIGQLHKRISESVQDPLTATVLALETLDSQGGKEQAVMVSCDVIYIRAQTQKKLQNAVAKRLDGFEPAKLFLNATHTHTAPGFIDGEFYGLYDTSDNENIMKPSEFEAFFIERVADAVVSAWENRKPGGFSWGLGNAILGHNRRTVKSNGTARMYGVNDSDFAHYEGINDNRVQMLFFWDRNKELTGIVLNTVATAQVTDSTNYISADFYHEVRQTIRKKYGEDIFVFIQIGAAGDITPVSHEYTYKRAEVVMLKRKGISARQELANRVLQAVDEVMPVVRDNIDEKVVFKHTVAKVELPVKNPPSPPFYFTDSVKPAEFHVLRLGDIAMATNPFELFIDYGISIKAQSKAILTFLVQLSCQHSGYLPSERAAQGGGYSAERYLVGPEGGQKLVDETVKRINQMWD
ncbi:twin-arginine translocation signal domain-containing protein [Mariniphaga sediminis]|uniref:Twin-arginine translocation signal domain-containing protein n=1 Tax=Mariniphaga sediminis TaxID=1628158 RepID=A0A399D746_9BACT|nr:twin-arginine translocation signal domain-containing protein [Mariniphaga sediminis]RIH66968.1 twin-arginine translocation signal domain-containing protein [Mariniphaga sediminis]